MPSNYQNHSSKKPKARKPPASPSQPPRPSPSITQKTEDYGREQRHPSGPGWDRIKKNVISYYGGICGLCDHPGVAPCGQVDHQVVGYPLDNSIGNLRPAHGSSNRQKNPCPTCGLNCNNVRGGLSLEAGRAKIARRLMRDSITEDVNEDGREW